MAIFAMFGALMVASKLAMEALPNIHLIGMFTVLLTVCYRAQALIPIYLYAFLLGLIYGFDPTWWPLHLYVWTVLWGMTMLLPKKLPNRFAAVLYPLLCGLHGLLYGVLSAPYCLLTFYGGWSWEKFTAYVASGFYFDLTHGISNFFIGFAVLPLSKLIHRLEQRK